MLASAVPKAALVGKVPVRMAVEMRADISGSSHIESTTRCFCLFPIAIRERLLPTHFGTDTRLNFSTLVRTVAGRGSSHRQERLTELFRSVRRHHEGQCRPADAQLQNGFTGLGLAQPHGIEG